ncbi:class F sortase [Paenibacillus xylanexedens]|uniref:class F sortase n=1 Tax=Paenibacillus xylanexedens TaxID=528191 RepID=UPI003D003FDC
MTKRSYIIMLMLVISVLIVFNVWGTSFQKDEIHSFPIHQEVFKSKHENTSELNTKYTLKTFKPVRICIPTVQMSTKLVPVGLQLDGRLGVPESSLLAGYFKDGVMPGEPGNALIAGHVDDYKGPGVFYPLKKLKPDALVFLFDAEHRYLTFRVEQVEAYFTKEAPLDRIFGDTNDSRLNLITCTGIYNRNKKEHEQRLVVYTRLLQ